MSDSGGHAPHLAVATLGEGDLDPGGGHTLAVANRRIARRQRGLTLQQMDLSGTRAVALDGYASAQPAQSLLFRNAFDLRPIAARMAELGIAEPVLQLAVRGKEHQAFAVAIEPAHGVDTFDRDIFLQRVSLAGELAEHAEGLIEDDVAVRQISDYRKGT